ncbi:hypothetical protein L596_009489 [Steinernema carpocapsae]|uniref:Uncharacterized protein n=1 Tax=Steinernema carpocapsae TaxID=34508 RepID=A0A4U5PFS3_STECR|nr:hypothetical protein L596_009489 [Steinernema carpocapsae]
MDPHASTHYGLLSPQLSYRIQSLVAFSKTLPAPLIEENFFLEKLETVDAAGVAEDSLLRDAVDITSKFVLAILAVQNPAVDHNEVICSYFNLMGSYLKKDYEAKKTEKRVEEILDELEGSKRREEELKEDLFMVNEAHEWTDTRGEVLEDEIEKVKDENDRLHFQIIELEKELYDIRDQEFIAELHEKISTLQIEKELLEDDLKIDKAKNEKAKLEVADLKLALERWKTEEVKVDQAAKDQDIVDLKIEKRKREQVEMQFELFKEKVEREKAEREARESQKDYRLYGEPEGEEDVDEDEMIKLMRAEEGVSE